MDPTYATVVDPNTLVWTMVAYVLHGAVAAAQAGLLIYLVFSGVRAMRTGALAGGAAAVLAGLGLALPWALGVPAVVSGIALAGGLAWLVFAKRPEGVGALRVWARRAALAATGIVALFFAWEREDNLALTSELLSTMQTLRADEVEWQLAADREAPKVGDFAPEFELQDVAGNTTVRLSDFRGVRPVALVFGSYT